MSSETSSAFRQIAARRRGCQGVTMAAGAPPSTGAVPICRIGFQQEVTISVAFRKRDNRCKKRGVGLELLQIGRVSHALLSELLDGSAIGVLEGVESRVESINRVLSEQASIEAIPRGSCATAWQYPDLAYRRG